MVAKLLLKQTDCLRFFMLIQFLIMALQVDLTLPNDQKSCHAASFDFSAPFFLVVCYSSLQCLQRLRARGPDPSSCTKICSAASSWSASACLVCLCLARELLSWAVILFWIVFGRFRLRLDH